MKIRIVFFALLFFSAIGSEYAQDFEWLKYASSGTASGQSVCADQNGNVYTSGYFESATNFEPSSGIFISPLGLRDTYISKHDPSGNLLWVKVLGKSGYIINGYSIAIDTLANVYLTGMWSGSGAVDFDPGTGVFNMTPLNTGSQTYILKLDSQGGFVWARQFESSAGNSNFSRMSIDYSGNVLVTGMFVNTVDFDPGAGNFSMVSSGGQDGYACKLDGNGNFIWAGQVGGVSTQYGTAISADHAGNMFVLGNFTGVTDVDPGPSVFNINSNIYSNIFICKLDPSGNFVWVKQFGGTDENMSTSVVLDNQANLYIGGNFKGTTDFDPGTGVYSINYNGNYDVFITKLDSSGNFIWANKIGSVSNDYNASLKLDKNANVYTFGNFAGTTDFDPGLGVFNLSGNTFLSKLDSSGNFIWAGSFNTISGPQQIVNASCMYLDSAANIYLTGGFIGGIDFDLSPDTFLVVSTPYDLFAYTEKISQDFCSNVSLTIDSVLGVSCLQMGFANANVAGAVPPVSVSWNTLPSTNDSSAFFTTPGIYTVQLIDSNGCARNNSVLVGGYQYFNDYDLNVNAVVTTLRPGFPSKIFLDGFNEGCLPVSGTLAIVLDTLVIFDSASPAPDNITGSTLSWNFSSITNDSAHIVPVVFVTVKTSAVFGDTAFFDASIIPASGDVDSLDNFKTVSRVVINAYDPNIKSVNPEGECPAHYVLNNQKITYTVQFQNTGNSSAININVLDTIDVNLDLGSVNIISHSHPLITEVLPGNVLKFRFDSIILPDSSSNETMSHAYVIYEIKPLAGNPDGTEIKNHADIYFDFNAPVITNTTLNTLVSVIPNCNLTTSVSTQPENSATWVYPNPTNGEINFKLLQNEIFIGAEVFDCAGKRVFNLKKSDEMKFPVEVENGIYFLKARTSERTLNSKIILSR